MNKLLNFSAIIFLGMTTFFSGLKNSQSINNEATYDIFPNPQSIIYEDSFSSFNGKMDVYIGSDIDSYTLNKTFDVLSFINVKASKVNKLSSNNPIIRVVTYKDLSSLSLGDVDLGYITRKIDAYYLSISQQKITILGKDTDSCFYGLTTLETILKQSGDRVRDLTIKDYSDSIYRGFIEGYYGVPWTMEERMELMRFGSRVKSNIYIYAPKDDSYHSSNWRGLYSSSDYKKLKEVIEEGRKTKTRFAWSIHPFLHGGINESNYEESLNYIINKFNQIYEAGCRQFVVSADDIGIAEGTILYNGGSLHKRLMNDLVNWKNSKEGCYNLIFVPSAYCYVSATRLRVDLDSYFSTLMDGLDESIDIMWTGNDVCSSISTLKADEFKTLTNGRKPFFWLNWPVNDYSTEHLLMGKAEVLNKSYSSGDVEFSGIVTNPMPEAEPSKIAIFAICDYSWNTKKFDKDKSYKASMKYIDEKNSEILEEISMYLSNANEYEGKLFEEAPTFALLASDYNNSTTKENKEKARETMINYLTSFSDRITTYSNNAFNKKLFNTIKPWVNSIKDTVDSLTLFLQLLQDNIEDNEDELKRKLNYAEKLFQDSRNHLAPVLNPSTYNIDLKPVRFGAKVVAPFVNKIRFESTDKIKLLLGEPTGILYSGFEGIYEGETTNILDNDESTYCWFQGKPSEDAFIRIDFGETIDLYDVIIKFGTTTNHSDIMKGVLEYSLNGQDFTPLGEMNSSTCIFEIENGPISVRFLRLRNTSIEEGRTWVAIKEILINDIKDHPRSVTSFGFPNDFEGNLEDIIDGNEETGVWFHGRPDADGYIQIDLKTIKLITDIEILSGAPSGEGVVDNFVGDVYLSYDGNDYKKVGECDALKSIVDIRNNPNEARYIRLVNSGTNHWVGFREVSVNKLPQLEYRLTYEGFAGIYENHTIDHMYDGNLETFTWFSSNQTKDAFIKLDLVQPIMIHDIEIINGKATGGDDLSALVELSMDDTDYQYVGKLGNGKNNFDLREQPIEARFVRIRIDETLDIWGAITELRLNVLSEDQPTISFSSDLTLVNDVSLLADNDFSTYAFFDWHAPKGAYVQIDYLKIVNIKNIILFQKGSEDSPQRYDCFESCTIYISSDGINFSIVGEEEYVDGENVIIDFKDNPIEARYIKVVSNSSMNATGICIKEFGINYDL